MNNLSNFGLALLLTISSLTPLYSQTENGDRYCNEDYHFCAFFPDYIFTQQTELVGNNGILLESKDGYVEMTVSVWPQPNVVSTEDIFISSANAKAAPTGKNPKIINSLFGEDFYQCFFLVDRYYYYHKSFHFEDHYVLLELKTPINMPDKMQIIRPQVGLEFAPVSFLQSNVTGGMTNNDSPKNN